MKKRLQLVVVLLMFLALVGALASCQYRPIQEYTTTEAPSYEVVFVDLDGTTVKTEKVAPGAAATAPRLPDHDGYVFVGWDVDFSQVYSPLTVTAQYVKVWTVTFVDHNGSEINTFSVLDGEAAPTPVSPYRENHTFAGWDKDFTSVKGDMVIKATYVEDPKFTVEFLGFNGELLNTQKVYQGKNAILPTPPSVLHYTFKGWDQSTENVTGNMTVNAIYEENAKFTVLFLDHLGNELKSEVVYIGEDATAPNAPEVDNYTFAGWDKAFVNVQGDLTVSATYTENAKYTVQFVDYNGNVLHSEVVYVGKDATAPADPSRENHDFAGWDKAYTNVQGDLTVNAKYTEHAKFTVEFVDHDGKVLSSQVIYIGKDATAPADPSRENYDFAGWDKAFTNIQSDLTVNATYTEHEKFTVEFVDHDGRVLSSQVIYIGKDATAPADPSRENHDFAGWDKAYTNVQGNLTVTAKYTEHAKFTVTFVNYDGAVLKTETVYIGKDATAPADPSRENYFFAGWDKAYTNVQGDLTVTAIYTEYQNFTVTFVDRDGNVLKTEVVRQGNAATAPNAPAVENHDFAGWDKAFDNVQSDLTVTAKYTEHAKYTVQFLGKDGTVLKTETVYVGKAATAPDAPAVENHDFAGWDKAFDNVQSDLTVTAKYTEHAKYTVQFLGKDGDVLKTETVYRGKGATAPEAPVVEGFTFKGWDIAFDAVTDDLTVRAIYEANDPVDPPVNPPESNVSYSVMHWTFGANTVYIGGYANKIVAAIEEADPDIVIMNGLSSAQFGNITVPGYTCWAYGVNRDQDAAGAGETSFRYVGGAMAVFFKTDKFTKAGDVFCPTEVGYSERYFSYVVFPLQDAQGNKIPVVSAGMSEGSDAKNPKFKLAELMASLKENLGSDAKNAVIRLSLTATQLDGSNLKDSLSVEGFVSDQGTDIKKVAETVPASNFYAYMITSNASSVSAHAPVASTADATTYPIYQGTNNAFITVAQTVTFNFAGIADTPVVEKHTVTFVGQDGAVLKTEEVEHGKAATAPEAPAVNGYDFSGWDVAFDNVQGDLTVNAIYTVKKYTVTFVGHDGAVLKTEEVEHGKAATAPEAPAVEGFEFKGWDIAFEAITDSLTVTAVYEAVSGGEEEYEGTPIRTQEELAALANATAGVYTIIADLELVDWTSIALPAGVVLGGNNHTVKGLTTALFSEVHGTVKNLKIADADIVGTTNSHKYGVLANKLFDGAVVSHVDIVNCNLVGYYAGGIAAEAEGNVTIEYCTVSGSVKQASTSGNALVGGILGRYLQPKNTVVCTIRIDHCTNNATISVSSNNASAGGIIGNYGQGMPRNEIYISNCINNGTVTMTGGNSNAAGILAYAYRCGLVHIEHCTNNAIITNEKGNAGGIVSLLESGSSGELIIPLIYDCINQGDVKGNNNVGGIIGTAGTTGSNDPYNIKECVNYGDVTGAGNKVGGIVGDLHENYKTFNLFGCSNHGAVTGLDEVGGIVGGYSNATVKFYVCANYGDVTATDGAAGGFAGAGHSDRANTVTVNSFLQTGNVSGKVAGSLFGVVYAQKYTATYPGTKQYTATGKLYQEAGIVTTIKATACVLSGSVSATELAGELVGAIYSSSTPIFTLKDVISDVQVTEKGSVNPSPASYYQVAFAATAGDADLIGTENEGMTAYYGRAASAPSYMVAYEPNLSTAVAVTLDLGEIVGGINASVETEGSAAYILNQAAIALGEEYPTWKNGETYPEIQLQVAEEEAPKYTVTFLGKDGQTLKTEEVEEGKAATAPSVEPVAGYRFDGWDVAFDNVQGNLTVTAKFVKTWTVTYLDAAGEVWKTEIWDEGSTVVMPEAPTLEGYTFKNWDPEVIAVLTQDVVVSPVYSVDAPASAESYKVMAWSYGGNLDFVNSYNSDGDDFSKTLKQAVSEVNPDIIILDGCSSTDFLNQIAIDGYTCWAYGVHRGNNATDSDPQIATSLGYGRAILYKTDKFTQAGTPQHDLNGNSYSLKDGNRSYVIFPLQSIQSNAIIDVVNAWAYNNTEDQLQEMITAITEKIGTSAEQSLIHLRIASNTDIGLAYNGKFNTEADANGYSITNYGGIVTKKDGDHANTHASNYYYSYMLSYAKGSVGVKDYAVVSATEDTAKYVNMRNASYGAWYTKAFALNFEMGSVEEVAEHTVTFDGEGVDIPAQTIADGGVAERPADPVREGFTFAGWLLNGEAYDFTAPIVGDITLTASWTEVIPEPETFTVTFIGHGGAELGSQEVEHGKAATAPEAPAVEGYTFKGWDKAFDNVTEDMTVTAIYEEAAVAPSSSSTIKVIDLHTEKIAWNYTVSTFFADVLPLLTDYDVIIISGARDAVLPEEYAADWGMQTVNYSRNTGGAAKAHIIIYRLSKFTLDTTCEPLMMEAGSMALTDGGIYAIPLVEKASNRQIVVAGMYWGTWDKTNNKTTCTKAFTPAMTALVQAFPNADATIISTQFITSKYTCAGQGETISGLDGTAWVEGYDLKALSETDFVVSDVTYAHYVFTYAKDDALSISDNQVVAMPEQSTATGSVAFTATIE